MTTSQPDTEKLSDEYKLMIDKMLEQEASGEAQYVSAEHIKNRFLNQRGNL